jgi:hypothetical protein
MNLQSQCMTSKFQKKILLISIEIEAANVKTVEQVTKSNYFYKFYLSNFQSNTRKPDTE